MVRISHHRQAELCVVTALLLQFQPSCSAFSASPVLKNTIDLSVERQQRTKLEAGRQRRSSTSRAKKGKDASIKSSDAIYPHQQQEQNTLEQNLLINEAAARQRRIGQAKHRLEKNVRREERISILEMKMEKGGGSEFGDGGNCCLSSAEVAELNGLLKVRDSFEEQYDPLTFTKEHVAFKSLHNDAFIALARYCEQRRSCSHANTEDEGKEKGKEVDPINVFFLDGPDAGTTSGLIDRGNFNPSQCFVANRHKSTCDVLRISGGGRLPDKNVVHATASEALTVGTYTSNTSTEMGGIETEGNSDALMTHEGGDFSSIDFGAYYFDGCGGFVPHIINMLSAALLNIDMNNSCTDTRPIVIGYSILGSYKDVVEKELTVSRAMTIIARRRGMRIIHVLDDPERFGISQNVRKTDSSTGGGTFTTWLYMESDN